MVGSHWYGVEPEPDIELRDLFWRPGSGELFFEYDGGLWAVDARPGGKRGGPARSR
jgi:hypothetical protein